MNLDKKEVQARLLSKLESELHEAMLAARAAHEAATGEENRAENQYDTRGLEASYLAGASAKRIEEIKGLVTFLKVFTPPSYSASEPIGSGALIQLRADEKDSTFFLLPRGGGVTVSVGTHRIQTLSLTSPFGDAIVGKKVGEFFVVEGDKSEKEYEIVAIC